MMQSARQYKCIRLIIDIIIVICFISQDVSFALPYKDTLNPNSAFDEDPRASRTAAEITETLRLLNLQKPVAFRDKDFHQQVMTAASNAEKTEVFDIEAAFLELERAGQIALERYSNVHRGTGQHSLASTELFEKAREIILEYFGFNKKDYIVVFGDQKRITALREKIGSKYEHRNICSKDLGLALGVSVLVVHKSDLPKDVKDYTGGGTVKLVTKKFIVWADAPDVFEAGTPNIVGVILFAKALKIISKTGNAHIFNPFYTDLLSIDSVSEVVSKTIFMDGLTGVYGKDLLDRVKNLLIGKGVKVPTKDGDKPYINLDNGASTPTFVPMWEAVKKALRQPPEVQNEIVKEVAKICGSFFNAPQNEYEIIFTNNTTDGTNLAAENLRHSIQEGETPVVLSSIIEHNSNELPWRQVPGVIMRRMPVDSEGFIDLARLEKILKEYNKDKKHGNKRIKIVTVTGASNVLGSMNDISEISRIAHKYGAEILVDAAQLAAHRKIDMQEDNIDYLVFSGHKMYAPFGTGGFIAKKQLLKISSERLDDIKKSGIENIAGVTAVGKAMDILMRIGMDVIEDDEHKMTAQLLKGIAKTNGIKVYGIKSNESKRFKDRSGVITFSAVNIHHQKIAELLAELGGIGVRNGCFCSHLLLQKLLGLDDEYLQFMKQRFEKGFSKKEMPGVLRVSIGLENTKEDIETFLMILKHILDDPSLEPEQDRADSAQNKFVKGIVREAYEIPSGDTYQVARDLDLTGAKKGVTDKSTDSFDEDKGALKNIGSKLSLETLAVLKSREAEWIKKVKDVDAVTYILTIQKKHEKKERVNVRVKFLSVGNELPQEVNAWRVGAGTDETGGYLVIAIRGLPEDLKIYIDELLFHELRESYWATKGVNPSESHVLASVEQVLGFAKRGRLTTYHSEQISKMTPKGLVELIREHKSGERETFHYRIIAEHEKELEKEYGTRILRRIEDYEARIMRHAAFLLFQKNSDMAETLLKPEDNLEVVRRIISRLSTSESAELTKQVREITGKFIEGNEALIRELSGWYTSEQMSLVLDVDKGTLLFREEAGDINSVVKIGKMKFYNPLKILREFIAYDENKDQLISQRQVYSIIQRLYDSDPDRAQFRDFAAFICQETGIEVTTPNEAWEIVKDWFNIKAFSDYLGLDRNTIQKLIQSRGLKTYFIESDKGKPIEFVSPQSVAVVEKELKTLLSDVEAWYSKEFGEEVKLKDINDLRNWFRLNDLLEIFTFVGKDTIRRIPNLRAYKAKIPNLVFEEYYIPPVEVEQKKREVVSWVTNEKVFPILVKYGVFPADIKAEDVTFEKARNALLKIKNTWLSMDVYSDKSVLSLTTVRNAVQRGEIDAVQIAMFSAVGYYYIPPELITRDKIDALDKSALEAGKKFLEDICGVEVSSLSDVRRLLSENTMTSAETAQILGISKIKRLSERTNTIVLQFTGDTSPIVYWKKSDAEAFLAEENGKFESVLEQVSQYSDVSEIKTRQELIDFLNSEWKSVTELSEEMHVHVMTLHGAVSRGRLFGVSVNLAGFRPKVYIPPDNITLTRLQQITDFEANANRIGTVFDGLFSQFLNDLPAEILSGRINYLKGIFSKYIKKGTFQFTGVKKPATQREVQEQKVWGDYLRFYISNYIARKLWVLLNGDIGPVTEKMEEFITEIEKRQKSVEKETAEYQDLTELKELFERILSVFKGTEEVRIKLAGVSHPKPYQLFSIARILENKRVILADDTRLGKSYEALLGSRLANNGKGAKKTVIVCKNTAMGMWAEEIKKHMGVDTPYAVIDASTREERFTQFENARGKGVKYVIMNFETCREYIDEVKKLGADFTVIDEAHHIGKAAGKHNLRDAVFQIDTPYRILLSATPIRNKYPDEVYPFLHWLFPEKIGSLKSFREQFGRSTLDYMKIKVFLWNVMIRFTRDEVDTGGARHSMQTRDIQISGLQRVSYEQAMEDFGLWYKSRFGEKAVSEEGAGGKLDVFALKDVLSKLFRLREAACIAHVQPETEVVLRPLTGGHFVEITAVNAPDVTSGDIPLAVLRWQTHRSVEPLARTLTSRMVGGEVKVEDNNYRIEKKQDGKYTIMIEGEEVVLNEGGIVVIEGRGYMAHIRPLAGFSNKIEKLLKEILPGNRYLAYESGEENIFELMNPEDKIVIFTESLTVMDTVIRLDSRIRYINNQVPREKRDQYLKDFNKGPGPQILVVTRATAGESISLAGATKVIEMDLPFTVRTRTQANDRVLGPAQKIKNVPVVFLKSAGTIDEDLLEYLATKQSIIDAFIKEGELNIQKVVENLFGRMRIIKEDEEEDLSDFAQFSRLLTRTQEDRRKVEETTGIVGICRMQNPYRSVGDLGFEKEKTLIELVQKEHNGAAFDVLVLLYIDYVRKIAGRWISRNYRLAPDYNDMLQEAIQGMMTSIFRFDISKKVRLYTYMTYWIESRIRRYVQDNSRTIRIPVHVREKLNLLSNAENAYFKKFLREPAGFTDIKEFNPSFELTEEQYLLLIRLRSESFKSLDASVIEGEKTKMHELVAGSGAKEMEDKVAKRQLLDILDKALAQLMLRADLSQKRNIIRNVQIIALRVGYDFEKREIVERMTLEEIGERYDMTRENVRQIEDKYLPVLRKILQDMGMSVDYLEEDEGALKTMGPELSKEVLLVLKAKEKEWLGYAEKVSVETHSFTIKNLRGDKNKITLCAKIVYTGEEMPAGVNAWRLGTGTDKNREYLIIAVRGLPITQKEYMNEILYHESREAFWMSKGFTEREAHILASVEQEIAFSVNNGLASLEKGRQVAAEAVPMAVRSLMGLTPLHLSMIEKMNMDELAGILIEDRKFHNEVILNNQSAIEDVWGKGALSAVFAYKDAVKRTAADLLGLKELLLVLRKSAISMDISLLVLRRAIISGDKELAEQSIKRILIGLEKSGLSAEDHDGVVSMINRINVVVAQLKGDFFGRQKRSGGFITSRVEALDKAELERLSSEVSRMEGIQVKSVDDLIFILSSWKDIDYIARKLGFSDRTAVTMREKSGDIASFVTVGPYKRYHPEKPQQEYIDFMARKRQIATERRLKACVFSMSPALLGELSLFVFEETGIRASTPGEIYPVVKKFFNVKLFAEHLGYDETTMRKIMEARNMRTFGIRSDKGMHFVVISPKSIAELQNEIREFLSDAARWHEETFGQPVKLEIIDDFRKWYTMPELAEIFPFVEIHVWNNPNLRSYKPRLRHLLRPQYFFPPMEVERLKNEVINWTRNMDIFSLLKKYKIIAEEVSPENINFEQARDAIIYLKNNWLKIEDFAVESGYSATVVRGRINARMIDAINVNVFFGKAVFYIPREAIAQLKAEDVIALEEGKRFLEEECGVMVPSLDSVRDLLKKHCMTNSEIAKRLQIPTAAYTSLSHVSKRYRTVKLKFTGVSSEQTYWKREDAEAFILEEDRKFGETKEIVGRYSDVSGIVTKNDLVDFLEREWKTVAGLSEELHVTNKVVKTACDNGNIFGLTLGLTGYRRQIYIPPGEFNLTRLQRMVDFERGLAKVEDVFSGLFSQILSGMPIEILAGRLTYLKSIISRFICAGAMQLTNIRHPKTQVDVCELRLWEGNLRRYIGNYTARKLFLDAGGDISPIMTELDEFIKQVHKKIISLGEDSGERQEFEELIKLFEYVNGVFKSLEDTRDRLKCISLPFGYQLFSIARIVTDKRVILADDTRLGKSYEALMGSRLANNGKGVQKTVIVCNNTAIGMWMDEIKKHISADTPYVIIDAETRIGRLDQFRKAREAEIKYVIINFETCREYIEEVKKLGADYAVLDEAHHIGKAAGRHDLRNAIFKLDTKYRVLLSATPIRNKHPDEVWPLLHWAYPDEIGSYEDFRKEFGGCIINQMKLKVFLKNAMVRFTREEVEKGGARLDSVEELLVMNPLQLASYESALNDFAAWYEGRFGVPKEGGEEEPVRSVNMREILGKLFRLREAACMAHVSHNTDIVLRPLAGKYRPVEIGNRDVNREIKIRESVYTVRRNETSRYVLENSFDSVELQDGDVFIIEGMPYMIHERGTGAFSNKLARLVENVTMPMKAGEYSPEKQNLLDCMNPEDKIVVFTESLSVMREVTKLDPRIRFINSKVRREERDIILKELNEDKGPQVLVATRATTGESVSLAGATKVIELDLPFTVRQQKQANDRVLGASQALAKVPVVYLATEGTIDEDLVDYLDTKQAISDAFMNEGDLDIRSVVENLFGKLRILKTAGLKDEDEKDKQESLKKGISLSRTLADAAKVAEVMGVAGLHKMKNPYKRLGRAMTREEESALIWFYENENNGIAFDLLVLFWLPYVKKIVASMINRNPRLVSERDDLVSEGLAGLIHGIEKFDLEKGFRLSTYITAWIYQSILRYIGNNSHSVRLPVHIQERISKLNKVECAFINAYGELPKSYNDIKSFDSEFELTESQYQSLVQFRFESFKSLDESAFQGEGGGRQMHELVAGSGAEEVEDKVAKGQLLDILDKAFSQLAVHSKIKGRKNISRDIQIVALRLGYDFQKREIVEQKTLEEVGGVFDMTRERIRQIVDIIYLPVLRKILEGMGIDTSFFEEGEGAPKNMGPKSEINRNRRHLKIIDKPTVAEIKEWPSGKIIAAEKELVSRFGYKGWNLLISHALSREIGGFAVPDFEIIEIDELWKPFYEANKEKIDYITRIVAARDGFVDAVIEVHKKYTNSEERKRILENLLDNKFAILKELFNVNNLEELGEAVGRSWNIEIDFSNVRTKNDYLNFILQVDNKTWVLFDDLREDLLEKTIRKYWSFISQQRNIFCRTSATDEDTKDNAKAGKYKSGTLEFQDLEYVKSRISSIFFANILSRWSLDTNFAFILQKRLGGDDLEGGVLFSNLFGDMFVELGYAWREGIKSNPLKYATSGKRTIILRVKNSQVLDVLYNNMNPNEAKLDSEITTAENEIYKCTISQESMQRIIETAKRIEEKYGYPVDIEFGIQGGEIFIVQIRPVTAEKAQPEPVPQFGEEDIVACLPVSVNSGEVQNAKIIYIDGITGPGIEEFLREYQEKVGYNQKFVACFNEMIEPENLCHFLYGDKLFWIGKGVCKIGHAAINTREQGRHVVMGYFGDIKELEARFGEMQNVELTDELKRSARAISVSEGLFDIYSNGDRAVLVKAGAVPVNQLIVDSPQSINEEKQTGGNVTSVEAINQVIPPQDKPVLAVFDVHGTLLEPNWKDIYRRLYKELTGHEMPDEWMDENVIHKSNDYIVNVMSEISGEKEEIIKEMMEKIGKDVASEIPSVMPGALDLIKTLSIRGVPIVVISGSQKEIILHQLKKAGFLEYIKEENVIGSYSENRKDYDRGRVIESLNIQYPFHTIAYFDDWTTGVQKVKELGGICFGIPQGTGSEFTDNRSALVSAGVDYILHGWSDCVKIDEILTVKDDVQRKNEKIPVAKGAARKVVSICPAVRHTHIPLHIEISDDMKFVTYSLVEDDSEVFSADGSIDYDSLKIRKIITIPSSHLITPARYIESNVPPEIKNVLQPLLSQSKRYTKYKGITTSWDSGIDKDVWTTNIDTVFLHKGLEEMGLLDNPDIESVIEIGTGGGHLSTLIAARLPALKKLSITDISVYALRTAKRCISAYLRRGIELITYWGKGLKFVDGNADLIIVNPPYIPTPPFMDDKAEDPYRGTGLIREILEMGASKLNPSNPDACVVINISSLAKKDFDSYVSEFGERFDIEKVGEPLEVPLKIWAITQEWKDWLVKEGGLRFNPDAGPGEEPYWHVLQLYRIKARVPVKQLIDDSYESMDNIKKPTIAEIKQWPSEKIIAAEKELVARFGYKGWNLLLATALSQELGGFSVPDFEIIEINELWKLFYEANKEVIDEIIELNIARDIFLEIMIYVFSQYTTPSERSDAFKERFEELVYFKRLLGINTFEEFESKLHEVELFGIVDLFSVPEGRSIRSLMQVLDNKTIDLVLRLKFDFLKPLYEKYDSLVFKDGYDFCRTSATDEDTKDDAKAGKYYSREIYGDETMFLEEFIRSNLKKLKSRETALAFILQKKLSGDNLEGGIVFSDLFGNSVVELGCKKYKADNPLEKATHGTSTIILRVHSGIVKDVSYNWVKSNNKSLKYSISLENGESRKITISEIVLSKIVNISKQIEQRLGYPVDIEFGVDGENIYIVQIRPVTGGAKEREAIPEFDKEDIVAEIPHAVGAGIAKNVKIFNAFGSVNSTLLYKLQESLGYGQGLVVAYDGQMFPGAGQFLFGSKLFWLFSSILKIGHQAINERQYGRNVVMGYFGDFNNLMKRLGKTNRVTNEWGGRVKTIGVITKDSFDIYCDGDRAVLVRAGAVPIGAENSLEKCILPESKPILMDDLKTRSENEAQLSFSA